MANSISCKAALDFLVTRFLKFIGEPIVDFVPVLSELSDGSVGKVVEQVSELERFLDSEKIYKNIVVTGLLV